MRRCRRRTSALVAAVLLELGQAGSLLAQAAPSAEPSRLVREGCVLRQSGTYRLREGACEISISTAELGGFARLVVRSEASRTSVDDVTGVAWVDASTLVFAVSPIYGRPGVFSMDCRVGTRTRLVAPKTITKAYPKGADYFELASVVRAPQAVACFYYTPDVEAADFSVLRTDAFLQQVALPRGAAEAAGAQCRVGGSR
jgi:hypothetical protein